MASDEEEVECPLCMEELDLSDRNFRPCPCGYQVCRFCWHHIKENLNGRCPACRRIYSEQDVEFVPMTAEEIARMQKERKVKERQQKGNFPNHRKNLNNVRLVQRSLVYVVGLSPSIANEETLRDQNHFGQYGKIVRIMVNKRSIGPTSDSSSSYSSSSSLAQGASQILVTAYITYAKERDAAKAIYAVNGTLNESGRSIRASFGTTKYCMHYLKGAQCTNPSCMYLHEPGDDAADVGVELRTEDIERLGLAAPTKPKLVAAHPHPVNHITQVTSSPDRTSRLNPWGKIPDVNTSCKTVTDTTHGGEAADDLELLPLSTSTNKSPAKKKSNLSVMMAAANTKTLPASEQEADLHIPEKEEITQNAILDGIATEVSHEAAEKQLEPRTIKRVKPSIAPWANFSTSLSKSADSNGTGSSPSQIVTVAQAQAEAEEERKRKMEEAKRAGASNAAKSLLTRREAAYTSESDHEKEHESQRMDTGVRSLDTNTLPHPPLRKFASDATNSKTPSRAILPNAASWGKSNLTADEAHSNASSPAKECISLTPDEFGPSLAAAALGREKERVKLTPFSRRKEKFDLKSGHNVDATGTGHRGWESSEKRTVGFDVLSGRSNSTSASRRRSLKGKVIYIDQPPLPNPSELKAKAFTDNGLAVTNQLDVRTEGHLSDNAETGDQHINNEGIKLRKESNTVGGNLEAAPEITTMAGPLSNEVVATEASSESEAKQSPPPSEDGDEDDVVLVLYGKRASSDKTAHDVESNENESAEPEELLQEPSARASETSVEEPHDFDSELDLEQVALGKALLDSLHALDDTDDTSVSVSMIKDDVQTSAPLSQEPTSDGVFMGDPYRPGYSQQQLGPDYGMPKATMAVPPGFEDRFLSGHSPNADYFQQPSLPSSHSAQQEDLGANWPGRNVDYLAPTTQRLSSLLGQPQGESKGEPLSRRQADLRALLPDINIRFTSMGLANSSNDTSCISNTPMQHTSSSSHQPGPVLQPFLPAPPPGFFAPMERPPPPPFMYPHQGHRSFPAPIEPFSNQCSGPDLPPSPFSRFQQLHEGPSAPFPHPSNAPFAPYPGQMSSPPALALHASVQQRRNVEAQEFMSQFLRTAHRAQNHTSSSSAMSPSGKANNLLHDSAIMSMGAGDGGDSGLHTIPQHPHQLPPSPQSGQSPYNYPVYPPGLSPRAAFPVHQGSPSFGPNPYPPQQFPSQPSHHEQYILAHGM